MIANSRFSRRSIIKAISGLPVACTLAPFVPTSVRAQGASPKRLVVVFKSFGFTASGFWPQVSGGGIAALGSHLQPLEAHKDNLLFVDGLDIYGVSFRQDNLHGSNDNFHGRGMSIVFTGSHQGTSGFAQGPSIDQVIADEIKGNTPFASLALGIETGNKNPHGRCFYASANAPVEPETDPVFAWDRVFKSFQPPVTDPQQVAAAEALKARKKKVFDVVLGDLTRLRNSLAVSERAKLDDHLDAVDTLKARVDSLGSGGLACDKPARPSSRSIDTHFELVAAALACDVTRVASVQIGTADGLGIPDQLKGQLASGKNYHNYSHFGESGLPVARWRDDMKRIESHWAGKLAAFLDRLASVKEGDGTLLDNTLVVVASDGYQSDIGAEAGAPKPHRFERFPFLLAGGANLGVMPGRVVKVSGTGVGPTQVNRLWVSVAAKLGVNMNKFGTIDAGAGPLAGV